MSEFASVCGRGRLRPQRRQRQVAAGSHRRNRQAELPPEGSQNAAPPKPTADPQHPVVLIETSLGNITVRLDREKALLTVDNFLSYVGASFYDQTIIHQVYKGQGILAGGYGTNMLEKPAHTPIRNEADNGLKNRRGTIAMVRLPDAIDSATCQFFINVADNPPSTTKTARPKDTATASSAKSSTAWTWWTRSTMFRVRRHAGTSTATPVRADQS